MRKVFKLFTTHYSKIIKSLAFTLAEVVLVMGIIGVVGVLAVSNAKKDTDTTEKVAQLRKTYDILNTAFAQAVTENGDINTWGPNSPSATMETIYPYLKLLKNCGTGTGCWKSGEQVGIGGSETSSDIDSSNQYSKAILSNGASIAGGWFIDHGDDESVDILFDILVDVNGKKGLNMFGNDIFGFGLKKDGELVPFYTPNIKSGEGYPTCQRIGIYCTAWVIRFGNMDYLKSCGSSLSWSGDHSCR